MVNVIVAKKRIIQVSTNDTAGIIDSNNPVTLKQTSTISSTGVSRLDHLKDVNPSGEVDGATLVYDSINDTYNVKKLDLANITGDLDGGTF
jgi:4-hydroxyphenylpyruvate dioxygenase-like putative hemolysin